eukprot:CAMPEP_0197625550 /NCGR_PEP_ID=MMETSP1338-20131121/4887_1 /TAXON_ID=43686 ORGANISM="Pelagodinium beii, Strain RCC1491" /NCGR_SAMPLE_ID=MMETSP1338 /ASSEMBLY_ACC=CAM_ASM_000754 /LENGTH=46 /DNA_ID= /DNA_START= /DNA_END= /DNA_ORIENTATION=
MAASQLFAAVMLILGISVEISGDDVADDSAGTSHGEKSACELCTEG